MNIVFDGDKVAFAQQLKCARITAGLSQNKLAQKAGIARSNITRLERGEHLPSLETLRRIAVSLGLQVSIALTSETQAVS